MINLRKKIAWVVGFIVFISAIVLLINYHNSFRKVYVNLGNNIHLSLYKDLGGKTYNYSPGRPLQSVNSDQTITLKTGVYDFVVSDPSHQFANPITKITVTHATNRVTINPFYSSQKLTALLATDRSAIQQALISQYPLIPTYYTINQENLYEYGNWYGAVLVPLSSQFDTVRVIMNNKNGNWTVAAIPQIIIGIPSNPSIPSDVIELVDQL